MGRYIRSCLEQALLNKNFGIFSDLEVMILSNKIILKHFNLMCAYTYIKMWIYVSICVCACIGFEIKSVMGEAKWKWLEQ